MTPAPAPGPAPDPTPKPNPTPKPRTARWVRKHANVQGTDPLTTVRDHIHDVARGASEDSWNELKTEAMRDAVRTLAGMKSVVVIELGVSWDPDVFEQVDWTYERSNRGVFGISPERGVVSVLLRHKVTGALHWCVVAHVVHHIEVNGLARVAGAITGQNARGAKHIKLIATSAVAHRDGGLVEDFRTRKVVRRRVQAAPVHGMADLNIDWKAEQRRKVAKAKTTSWFPFQVWPRFGITEVVPRDPKTGKVQGTHESRTIDRTWLCVRDDAGQDYRVTDAETDPRGSSDHNPVRERVEQSV